MNKFKWNSGYTLIAIYAFLVIAASITFGAFVVNFDSVWAFLQSLIRYLIPFVYGFGIAFILNPAIKFFDRIFRRGHLKEKTCRNLSILIVFLLAIVFLTLFLLIIGPNLVNTLVSIVKNISFYTERIDELIMYIMESIHIDVVPQEIIDAINSFFKSITTFIATSLMRIVSITTKITSGVIDAILGFIISIYMLTNKETLIAQIKRLLFALFNERFVNRLIEVAHDSNKKFTGFIVGKIIDSIIIGIICACGMYILKMPFISLVSIIVGVTNVIPYFGPFIGAIPGALLVFVGGGPAQMIGFLIFILILQQFDGNILGPAILGQSTGLDAMWVIFAILLFGGLYGFVGMVIGVPLLSVIFELIKSFISNRLEKKGMPKDVNAFASTDHQILDNEKIDD